MTSQKSQNSNMLLAFLTLLGVIVLVAVVGFFMLRKGPEIIQGQAEVTEYRVSSKVPGRILEFRVKEGQTVQAGDTLAILEAPDVMAKMEQARAAEAAAQAQNEKAIKGARQEQIQAAYEMWQKAIAGVDIAEKSYKRVKNLFDQGVMPALDNKTIRLKVYYMKDLGTYAAWKATKTTGQFDLKTFEVKATPVEKVDNLRPGMSVILKK